MSFADVVKRGRAYLTPRSSTALIPQVKSSSSSNEFVTATEGLLFPEVEKAIDGEDCDHECATCQIKLPRGWKIDEKEHMWGHLKGWSTHMLVATGKTDWTHDIEDEKGSVMEAVKRCKIAPTNGVLKLSASNMPLPTGHSSHSPPDRPTTVLLLPAFVVVENVTPATVPQLIRHYISTAPTTTTPLNHKDLVSDIGAATEDLSKTSVTAEEPVEGGPLDGSFSRIIQDGLIFTTHPCPHRYIILLCSQRTRDARCGQSAPLLRKEFERHLRPLRLYRDLHDERPGGVGIYFVSHVGGHKFSANVIIYRKEDGSSEASQCIWLGRVRPEDCEGIIKYTVLQGKVIKPERHLRAGFDRQKGLVSW